MIIAPAPSYSVPFQVADELRMAIVKSPMGCVGSRGLVWQLPAGSVTAAAQSVNSPVIVATQELGCALPHPFTTLSFMALPAIPALKLTDLGLVDVETFKVVSLFV
jgi:hypothetical protein